MTEDNFFEWEAIISGPPETPFEGGIFTARLEFPTSYPLNPPKMIFTTEMWHPNSKIIITFIKILSNSPKKTNNSI